MNNEVTVGLIARIAARYLSGAIVMLGIVDLNTSNAIFQDGDLTALLSIIISVVIGVATELFYVVARKLGWSR